MMNAYTLSENPIVMNEADVQCIFQTVCTLPLLYATHVYIHNAERLLVFIVLVSHHCSFQTTYASEWLQYYVCGPLVRLGIFRCR